MRGAAGRGRSSEFPTQRRFSGSKRPVFRDKAAHDDRELADLRAGRRALQPVAERHAESWAPSSQGLTAAGACSRPGAIELGASADAQFNRTERISCEKRFIGNKLAL